METTFFVLCLPALGVRLMEVKNAVSVCGWDHDRVSAHIIREVPAHNRLKLETVLFCVPDITTTYGRLKRFRVVAARNGRPVRRRYSTRCSNY